MLFKSKNKKYNLINKKCETKIAKKLKRLNLNCEWNKKKFNVHIFNLTKLFFPSTHFLFDVTSSVVTDIFLHISVVIEIKATCNYICFLSVELFVYLMLLK